MRVNRQSDPRWRWAGAAAAVVTLLSFALASPGLPSGTLPASLLMPMSGFVPDEALAEYADPEHLAAVPAGPGKVAQPVAGVLSATRVVDTLGESGIPDVALRAYKQAAAGADPSCGLSWTVLAAIGRVESDHGRFGGTSLRADGTGTMRIRGIPLDGRANVVLIRDTDRGALDGDTTYDRAVGPMQFIPSTWRLVMADGNGDGRADVHNIFDAALGAARYLCTGPGNLTDPADLSQAIRRYNNADSYVRVVLNLSRRFASGTILTVPSDPTDPAGPTDPVGPFDPATGRPASGDRRLALPWPTDRPANERWTQPRPPAIPWLTPRPTDNPATDDRTGPAAPTAPPVRLVPATPTPPLTTTITPPPTTKPSTPPKPTTTPPPPRPTTRPTAPPPTRPTPVPPTSRPTAVPPTSRPTAVPPTSQPTAGPPTSQPTSGPSTGQPTDVPSTADPTSPPSTDQPTAAPPTEPTAVPTSVPTAVPTATPTAEPTATSPTDQPTSGPSTPTTDSPEPSASKASDTAAVGWAPAMRKQVVRILKSSVPKTPKAPKAKASPLPKPAVPPAKASLPPAKPSPPPIKPPSLSTDVSSPSDTPSLPSTKRSAPSAKPSPPSAEPSPSTKAAN